MNLSFPSVVKNVQNIWFVADWSWFSFWERLPVSRFIGGGSRDSGRIIGNHQRALTVSSNIFTFQANILIWDTWTRYFILLVLHVPLVSAWYWGVFNFFHKIKNIFWHSFIQQKFKSILFLNTSPLDLLIFERNYKKDANTSWGQNMIFSFKV